MAEKQGFGGGFKPTRLHYLGTFYPQLGLNHSLSCERPHINVSKSVEVFFIVALNLPQINTCL